MKSVIKLLVVFFIYIHLNFYILILILVWLCQDFTVQLIAEQKIRNKASLLPFTHECSLLTAQHLVSQCLYWIALWWCNP